MAPGDDDWPSPLPSAEDLPAASPEMDGSGGEEGSNETRMVLPRERELQAGDVLKGRFELVEELGAGGMGTVFKACDRLRVEAEDRQPYVAVKVVGREFQRHPRFFKAFQREARRAQSLAHPNIVRVHDFDRDGPYVFITMEHLSGRSLDKIIKSQPPAGIPLAEALKVLKPVCSALAFSHEHRIVHCDIKPGNIFVTDEGVVKVIDFGIARAVKRADAAAGEATVFDPPGFSPPYASPEMIGGDEADPRDDIFSLACVTYEMLSGKRPFGDKGAALAHVKGWRPEQPPGLTSAQWSALKSGLAFSRSERAASVESFLTRLERRPGWKDRLMAVAAGMWAAVGRFLAALDPRPAWKNWVLPAVAGRGAAAGRFLVALDPRPAWKNWVLPAVAGIAIAAGRFLARLDPRPAWKNRRWPVTIGGLALALIIGLVWFPPPGPEPTVPPMDERMQVPMPPEPALGPPVPQKDEELVDVTPDLPVDSEDDTRLETSVGEEPPLPDAPSEQLADVQPPEREPAGPPSFRDCDECPEMIIIPAGRFTMGAPSTDPDAEPQEKQQREVAIEKDFALGRYAVTEQEWQACVEDGDCHTDPRARATDFPDHPKIYVNRGDARRFVRWLNQKTEQNYRLPTEEEWEYAARAGSNTRYPWGDEVGQNNANCKDCGEAMSGQGTMPVGSFAPNAFGLFNMVGNVWEWTETCGKFSADVCMQRIVRGGSWDNSASAVRVSQRNSVGTDIRADIVGLRVARDIPE